MKSREYIKNAKNMIINRAKFHAPIVFDANVDKTILLQNELDFRLPVFKFEKEMTSKLLKAFELAKREIDFNLIVEKSGVGKSVLKRLQKLDDVVVYDKKFCSCAFLQCINKLNINYSSSSNYDLSFKDKFVKIDGQELDFKFFEFALKSHIEKEKFVCDCTEFLLNGNNVLCSVLAKESCEIDFEINFPLKKGYYYFKRNRNNIKIENLITKESRVVNYFCKNAKFCFSNVSGLENSVYACVNLKTKLRLQKGEKRQLFFNFGEVVLPRLAQAECEKLAEISKQECQKIFDIKVKTKNPKFDLYFNFVLPKQIWIDWCNGKTDLKKHDKYQTLKRLFVKGDLQKSFQNFDKIGLREIAVFNGKSYKNITIIEGNIKFLRVGKTTFFNSNTLSQIALQSKENVCLCFG